MTSTVQEREPVSVTDSHSRVSQISFGLGGDSMRIPVAKHRQDANALRSFAAGAGEIHGKIYRALVRRYEAEGKDEVRFRKSLLRDLLAAKSIRPGELEALDEIVDITSRQRKGIDVARLRKIFEQFVDTDASPIAVSIASIAVNSGGVQEADGGTVAGADVGGGAAGGVLGGIGGAVLLGAIASFGAAIGDNATG